MNKETIEQFFRARAPQAVAGGVDVDDLTDLIANSDMTVEARDRAIEALACSASGADLYRLLQALEPASRELANDLAGQVNTTVLPFKRAQPIWRESAQKKVISIPQRVWFAAAASLVAALVVAVQHGRVGPPFENSPGVSQSLRASSGDEIFRAEMGTRVASVREGRDSISLSEDRIFTSQDRIFNDRRNGS